VPFRCFARYQAPRQVSVVWQVKPAMSLSGALTFLGRVNFCKVFRAAFVPGFQSFLDEHAPCLFPCHGFGNRDRSDRGLQRSPRPAIVCSWNVPPRTELSSHLFRQPSIIVYSLLSNGNTPLTIQEIVSVVEETSFSCPFSPSAPSMESFSTFLRNPTLLFF